jgi:hypothetical protein
MHSSRQNFKRLLKYEFDSEMVIKIDSIGEVKSLDGWLGGGGRDGRVGGGCESWTRNGWPCAGGERAKFSK